MQNRQTKFGEHGSQIETTSHPECHLANARAINDFDLMCITGTLLDPEAPERVLFLTECNIY